MIDLLVNGTYVVMFLLGAFELYQTYRYYRWDKKAQESPAAPAVTFYGGYIGAILVSVSFIFLTGATNFKLNHLFYVIFGIALMIVSILIFRRGHQMSRKLKKGESNLRIVQIYLIAGSIFFSGFLNLFK